MAQFSRYFHWVVVKKNNWNRRSLRFLRGYFRKYRTLADRTECLLVVVERFWFRRDLPNGIVGSAIESKAQVVGEADKILFWSWVRYKNLLGAKALTYSFYFLIFYTAILIMVLAF